MSQFIKLNRDGESYYIKIDTATGFYESGPIVLPVRTSGLLMIA